LAEAMGRSRLGCWLTQRLEDLSLAAADRIVVRGTSHQEWLARRGVRAEFIPDGVETDLFIPCDAGELRRQLGLDGVLTVGLVGSVIWNPKHQSCYGWELVELIRLLKDHPVAGLLIGDGTGLPILQQRCRDYGLEGRIHFLGRIPYHDLPRYLNAMDVCLSTQTNDLPGQVRTTGKLPLYLACGRFILASRVGEAARVLDEPMLVDYDGAHDPGYPQKLAARVHPLFANLTLLNRGPDLTRLARERFDYSLLAARLKALFDSLLVLPHR
jgi:glycosyltransferase involved in cell wall biosynthesis